MQRLALLIISILFTAPTLASAAGITSYTDASAETGGNYVGPGGSVTTGAQQASSYQYTSVDGQGQVDSQITTVENGVQKTQAVHQTMPSGGSVNVTTKEDAKTSKSNGSLTVSVTANNKTVNMISVDKPAIEVAGAHVPALLPAPVIAEPHVPNTGAAPQDDQNLSNVNWLRSFADMVKNWFSSLFL